MNALQLDPAGSSSNWGSSRPVFLVRFKDRSRVVIKGEWKEGSWAAATPEQSARWGGKMMRAVSSSVQTKPLTQQEIEALKNSPVSKCSRNKTREYLIDLIGSGQFFFYKMPFIGSLRDVKSMIEKGKVAKLLNKLKVRQVMNELGRIVAIDLFIGNDDRFDGKGKVVNPGNIFFEKKADKSYEPVGLDFFAAQGAAANLCTAPPDNWINSNGVLLNNALAMNDFATAAIKSLNHWCERLNAQIKSPTPLNEGDFLSGAEIRAFVSGMSDGAGMLRSYLTKRCNDGSATGKLPPIGVLRRMERLGWDW